MVSATRITHAIAAKMLAPIIVSFSTSRRATIEVPMRLPPHAGPGGGSSRNFLVTERIVTPHAPGADPPGGGPSPLGSVVYAHKVKGVQRRCVPVVPGASGTRKNSAHPNVLQSLMPENVRKAASNSAKRTNKRAVPPGIQQRDPPKADQ